MKRGDIVLIRFPFSDLSGSKVRPALVISDDSYTQSGRDAIFIVISSSTSNPQLNDILVDSSEPNFSITGLRRSSLIRVDKLVILSKNLARKRLGKADRNIMDKVEDRLIKVLGLTDKFPQSVDSNTNSSIK